MENKDIETLLAKEAIRDQIYTYCRAHVESTMNWVTVCLLKTAR